LSDQTHERSNPSLFFCVTLTTLIIFQEPESSSKKLRNKNDQSEKNNKENLNYIWSPSQTYDNNNSINSDSKVAIMSSMVFILIS
jgi:hypothetical protein